MKASSGFPSSAEPRPMGKCKILRHWVTDLDPLIIIHKSGSQRAPVTLGRCRKSRRKRKTTKATVRSSATAGGRRTPKSAIGIWIRFTYLEILELLQPGAQLQPRNRISTGLERRLKSNERITPDVKALHQPTKLLAHEILRLRFNDRVCHELNTA